MGNVKFYLNKNFRYYVGDLTDVAKKAIKIQKPKQLPALILSTSITTFGTYSAMKPNFDIHCIYKLSGVIKSIIVDIKSNGDLKALVGNKFIETDFDNKNVNKIPIKLGMGESGQLSIIRSFGDQIFSSEVEMVAGDIVTDLAWYMDKSDQIKSAVITDVNFDKNNNLERANSIIIEMLPNHSEKDIDFVEGIIKKNKLSKIGIKGFVKLLGGKEIGDKKIQWKTNFSLERAQKIIATIPKEEQEQIIKENGYIEIKDEFSNKCFEFKKPIFSK